MWLSVNNPSIANAFTVVQVMKNRPLPIAIIAFIFIISGFVGIVYHANEFFEPNSLKDEVVWTLFIRVIAIVCGLLLLWRVHWARWLAVAWLAYHVIIGALNSRSEMIAHFVL